MLAGVQINETGGTEALTTAELQEAYSTLLATGRESFAASAEQIRSWHRHVALSNVGRVTTLSLPTTYVH